MLTRLDNVKAVLAAEAVVQHVGQSFFDLKLEMTRSKKITHTMLDVYGTNEGNGQIFYELTDGVYVDNNLPLRRKNKIVNLSTAPTRLRVWMVPTSTNATIGGTSVRSVALRYYYE